MVTCIALECPVTMIVDVHLYILLYVDEYK